MQAQLEIIDLCSTTSNSNSEDEITVFLPIKPTTESPPSKPTCDDVIKQLIPNVMDNDYHDVENKFVPVIARPTQGLTVEQLFTLMIGTLPSDRICHRKPTSVTYNSVLWSIFRVFDVFTTCVQTTMVFGCMVVSREKNIALSVILTQG